MPGKKELLATALSYSGTNRVLRTVGSWRGLIVLNYHRIGLPAGSLFDQGVYSATIESFAEQLQCIAQHCDVIGVRDLERALLDPNGSYALITFDDGYRDNYEAAFPVLQSLRLPAVFFLTSGFLDDGLLAWWDEIAWMVRMSPRSEIVENRWTNTAVPFDLPEREQAVRTLLATFKQLPWTETKPFLDFLADATGSGRCPHETAAAVWMTWDMVREMHASGMSIGGHTVNHPILARLSAEQQHFEITHSCQRIAEELSFPPEFFSYPVGGTTAFNADTFAALQAANIRFAFTYGFGGYVRPSNLPYEIPRLPVESDLNLNRFRALATLPGLFSS
ncbi:MAG: polysaccharide deacetylase family protein [Planctomycetaceae bacterium]|nr:polysaccharide deacetylase family protein [Planctomycetaceae bacterium]